MPMKSAFLFSIGIHMAFMGYYYDFSSLLQSRGASNSYNVSLSILSPQPMVPPQKSQPSSELVPKPVQESGLAIKKISKQTKKLNTETSLLKKVKHELGGPMAGSSGIRSATALDRYLQSIRSAIKKNQFYPSLAKRLGHQGVVEARFVVGKTGQVIEILALKSDYSSLAQAVEELLTHKLEFPSFPIELASKEDIEISIPVRFELKQ